MKRRKTLGERVHPIREQVPVDVQVIAAVGRVVVRPLVWSPVANRDAPCADLVADHVVEVAAGGRASGPLRVPCRSENSRRPAWLATALGPSLAARLTAPRPPRFPTHSAPEPPSVVA